MTKKFKKRSLSESNVTDKSENKTANDVVVSPKKAKVEVTPNAQNNSVSKKVKKGPQGDLNVNKKKQEKGKGKNENSTKGATQVSTVKPNEENQNNQKQTSQEGGLNRKERNKLENNKLSKEKRKIFRREEGAAKTVTSKLTPEQLKEKIKELQSRESLTKSAKRKLGALKKILQIHEETGNVQENTAEEEANKMDTSETTNSKVINKKQNKKDSQEGKKVQQSKKQKNAKVQPGSLLKIKPQKDEDDDDDEEEDENEDDESGEEEENENLPKSKKAVDKKNVEEDEDEEEEEDESEDEVENAEEDENEVEDEDEDDDEDVDDEDDEDEDEDEDEVEENEDEDAGKKLKKVNEEKKKVSSEPPKKKGNEITNDKKQDPKKKRYVVFVSNVAYSATADQVRDHFLTKVSKITDVRIPKVQGTNKPRGFCYVELENQEDYEKALSLNHSFLEKRRIAVQYSTGSQQNNAKQTIVAKNKKFDALRKEGKFAGSKKQADKRVKKGKQNADSATA